MADNDDHHLDDPDDAIHEALVVNTSHLDADALVWVDGHGAGGEAGLHLVRVPERGAEMCDEPDPIRTLFARAPRQRARSLANRTAANPRAARCGARRPRPPVDDDRTKNHRDPHALLDSKRGDTDAQVGAAFARSLALHDPAIGGSGPALLDAEDAHAHIRTQRGMVIAALDALVAALAAAGGQR